MVHSDENTQASKLIRDYCTPDFYGLTLQGIALILSNIQFVIRHITLQMLSEFHRVANEESHQHTTVFLVVCKILHITNIPQDVLDFCLFPYSLHEKARDWFTPLLHEITT